MISSFQALLMILAAAAVTFLTRVIPFVLFGGKREIPRPVQYLGSCLPPAMIATLVVYCLKSISFAPQAVSGTIAQLAGVAVVVVLHLYRRNTLLSIGGGTLFYMVLIRVLV